ncbi:MAG: response regulator [Leptospiraceae bacterium]|nr:response regulator [Leptospiraceae bacterium]
MKVLALDDNQNDLEILGLMLQELNPKIEFHAVNDETQFLDKLQQGDDFTLFFVDIALGGSAEADSRGLRLLELIAGDYYYIPVCLVSGYFLEKVREVHHTLLGYCPQFIGFLDKMEYSIEDLLGILEKAQHFSAEQKKRQAKIAQLQEKIRKLQEELRHKNSKEPSEHLVQKIFHNLHFTPQALRGELDDHRAIHVLMHINEGNDHVLGTKKKRFASSYNGYHNVWEYRYSHAGRILVGLDYGRKDVLLVTSHAPWHD